jgi:tetratricopeptide (TPR) repeat protein
MSMPFASIKSILVLLVFIGLSGCGLFQTKPEIVDNQVETEAAIDPNLERVFSDALVLLRDEKFEQAEKELLSITEQFPGFAGLWSNLAIAQLSLKKYEAGLVSINASLSVDNKFCTSLSLKGVILRELGQFEEAKVSYLEAIECNPKDNLSVYNLGVLADLYMHDETSALFYYQTYLAAQGEQKDIVVGTWVVDLKRRVPEEQRIAIVSPASETDVQTEKAIVDKTSSEELLIENNEPQLAGEE